MDIINIIKEEVKHILDPTDENILSVVRIGIAGIKAMNISQMKEINILSREIVSDCIKSIESSHSQTVSNHIQQLNSIIQELRGYKENSSIKGQIVEHSLKNILDSAMPDATVTVVRDVAHSGDIVVEVDDIKIMIDSKIYKNTVPKKEIDKFKKDTEVCNCHGSVLVAFGSKISRIPNITLDTDSVIPSLYIPNAVMDESIVNLIRFMIATVKYIKLKPLSANEQKIKDATVKIAKCYNIITETKSSTDKIIKSMIDSLMQLRLDLNNQLSAICIAMES
jgi:hypothetical protein